MSSRFLVLFLPLFLSSSAPAGEKACAEDVSVIDLLPGSEIEMQTGILLDRSYSYLHDAIKENIYGVLLTKGKKSPSNSVFGTKTLTNRTVSIHFGEKAAKDAKRFKKGEIPPFRCKIEKPLSETDWYKRLNLHMGEFSTLIVEFEKGCPAKYLKIRRAFFDPRFWPMDLKSLRYNLGTNFKVHAKCPAPADKK